MSIASRITEMTGHIEDIYDTLEMTNASIYLLPNEYTQVDYIENSGTQFIDTGFKPNQNTSVEMEVLIPQNSAEVTRFFETRNTNYVNKSFGILNFRDYNNIFQFRYDIQFAKNNYKLDVETKYKIRTNKNNVYVNDEWIFNANPSSFQTNYNLALFGFANNSDNVADTSTYRLYSFKLYDNGVLIRDYVPCYRNSDNEVGLYDLVNNVFYTNNGTGSFTYGSVSREYKDRNIVNINANLKDRLIYFMNNGLDVVWENWEKVIGTGTYLTLNQTINAPMKMDLKGNTSQEVVSGEVGLEVEDTSIYVNDVNESKENYITLKGNTYQDSTTGATLGVTTNYTKTISDVSITTDANNIITINGTASNAINSAATDFVGASYTIPSGNCYWHCQYISGTVSYKSGETSGGIFINLRGSGSQQINGNSYQIKPTDYTQTKTKIYTLESDEIYDRIQFMSSNALIFNNLKLRVWLSSSESETYEPYTNGASPNPDYPQEIEVVTGENIVTICGKNVFNIAKLENASWNYPNSNTRVTMFLDKVAQGTKMSVTNRDTTNYRFSIGFTKLGYASRDNIMVNESGWQTTSTYTVTANGEGYPFLQISRIDNGNISASEVEGKFQFEYSDTPTTYEAYKGQTYPIGLDYTNLFKKQDISSDDLNKRLMPIGIGYNENGYFISPFIKVDKDTQYTINYTPTAYTRICYYASNNTNSFISKNDDTSSFTTPSTCQYLRFCNLMADIDNIRLEKGSTITNNYIELCKIGTYQDRIYKNNGNWYLHKEIGKVVLDGTNNVFDSKSGQLGNCYVFNTSNFIVGPELDVVPSFLSNKFIPKSWNERNDYLDSAIMFLYRTMSTLNFRFGTSSDITTLELANTWLSNNNVDLYGPLLNSTDTQITDTTLISQLNALYNATIYSTTHINTETSNLLPYINLKYNVVTASPSPDRASEVEVVTGNNAIKIQSKNLFDGEFRQGSWNSTTDTKRVFNKNNLFITKGTKCTFETNLDLTTYKYGILVNDSAFPVNTLNASIDSGWLSTNTYTFTATRDGYVGINIARIDNANFGVNDVVNYDYQLYNKSQFYNITLGNLELCKIGDYQDYFYKENGNWYKYGAIGKVVLDGSEDWKLDNTYNNINQYSTPKADAYYSNDGVKRILSNHFEGYQYGASWQKDNAITISASTFSRIRAMTSEYTTVNDFTNWLSTHNTTCYYVLATPTQTQITDQLLVSQLEKISKAKSYNTQTNISQSNANLPFILDATALKQI